MKIALGADHAGFSLKEILAETLRQQGYGVEDKGTYGRDSCDYTDYASAVAEAVASGEVERGVLVCGTGIGMSIAANRVPGVRAALVQSEYQARKCREHNDSNILVFGARVTTTEMAELYLSLWLTTPFAEGRHRVRIEKLDKRKS